jgi:hypothetical protein
VASVVCSHLALYPKHASVRVNQQITIHDEWTFQYDSRCRTLDRSVNWSSNGGTLKPIKGGLKAIFSSSKTGSYIVKAEFQIYRKHVHARLQVTVTALS